MGMIKYVKPIYTIISAEDVRNFKAAATTCPTVAVSCASAACSSTSASHTCGTSSVTCTKGASGVAR